MFLSLCYVVLRRVLQLAALRFRSNDLKELEIVVLRHELAILRRRTRRPAMTLTDRLFLAAASRLLPRARWRSFIITPGTLPWREFVRPHRRSMLAVDFFTVETFWLQRLYVLFFIELGSRRVHVAGCTPNPSAPWVTQQARHLTWILAERPESFRFLIRDRDQKFTDSCDEVFRSNGLEIIRTPFRAPQADGVAEPFVRTVRSECLDRLLILNDQHLERVLDVFVDHYNGHRPHRALALTPPRATRPAVVPATEWGEIRVQRRDRLGGVVHEYVLAA